MTGITAPQAFATVKQLVVDNKPTAVTALRWQNEATDSTGSVALPDTPATFAYTEFLVTSSDVIERGGGRGALRHRSSAHAQIFVFAPRDTGLTADDGSGCLDIAEAFAAAFRAHAGTDIRVDSATVYPGGDGAELAPKMRASEIGNYFWSAVDVDLTFDQIG